MDKKTLHSLFVKKIFILCFLLYKFPPGQLVIK